MNPVAQLLTPEDILLDLELQGKTQVFGAAGHLFERRHGFAQSVVVDSLGAREKLGSTGLGHGVALPHARIKNLARPRATYIRLAMPIDFDAPDAKPVSDLLVLLVPERATEEHLQILATFAQMLGDRGFRASIRDAVDEAAVCKLFSDWHVD